jgi:alanyl-tRNA synthetase
MTDTGGRLLHVLERGDLAEGQEVDGSLDWERRFDHMQQHTGQHILSQAFIQVLDWDTVSFHLGRELCTIDLTGDALTPELIYEVEDVANRIIIECRPVRVHLVDARRQSEFPLRKPSDRKGTLRIVEISDFDFSACGGTHCRSAGEVGLIKIRRWERAKKRARVEFYCGGRAFRDYRWKNRAVYRLSRLFSRPDREVVEAAREHLEREEGLRKRLVEGQDRYLESEAARLLAGAQEVRGIRVVRRVLTGMDMGAVRELARKLVQDGEKRLALLGLAGESPALVFARSEDLPWHMGDWIRKAAPLIAGRGGGSPRHAQARGSRSEGLEAALDDALNHVREED